MIDFPIVELLDDRICLLWSECHLHPGRLRLPHCGSPNSWVFRHLRHLPAYRRRDWDSYDTFLTGTAFEKTRRRPATLALLLRGVAKGESTAGLVQELGLSRKQPPTLCQRVQTNLNGTAPVELMAGTTFEADELDQNTGEISTPHRDPADPPRRRANKLAGHGTLADDRPPILSVIARETGAPRFWGCDHADTCACAGLIAENGPADSSTLDTDEGPSDRDRHPAHATIITAPTHGPVMMVVITDVRPMAIPASLRGDV